MYKIVLVGLGVGMFLAALAPASAVDRPIRHHPRYEGHSIYAPPTPIYEGRSAFALADPVTIAPYGHRLCDNQPDRIGKGHPPLAPGVLRSRATAVEARQWETARQSEARSRRDFLRARADAPRRNCRPMRQCICGRLTQLLRARHGSRERFEDSLGLTLPLTVGCYTKVRGER